MPTLAGWLTGEQVPHEIIEQTLATMGNVLGRHGGEAAYLAQPGAGLITFADPAYALQKNVYPPVLDWTPDRRTVVYHRPLSGAHPIYYVENWPAEGNLLFASEIQALFAVGVPRKLHFPALDMLLRYGFIPAPWTAFEQIHIVPAGSILRRQHSKTLVNHAIDFDLDELAPDTAIPDQFQEQLKNDTTALLPPHENMLALSGGSSISALPIWYASRQTETPFQVVSIGYKKSRNAQPWASVERIANACNRPFLSITGVDQLEFWVATLASLEAPCIDGVPFALHQLFHTAAHETGARVAINGFGAEPLLGIHSQHLASRLPVPQHVSSAQPETFDLLEWYGQSLTGRSKQQAAVPLWSEEAAQVIQQAESWEETLHARKLVRRAAQFPDFWQRWRYLDLHLRLPDQISHNAEKLATAERLALRSPYLTPASINLLTRLPSTLADGSTRAELASSLAKRHFEFEPGQHSDSSLVPPLASLLQESDSELLQQTLSPEAIRARGIFNPEAVQSLLQQRRQKHGKVPRELILVFTTQLLSLLFELK